MHYYNNKALTNIDKYIGFIEKQYEELSDLFNYMSAESINGLANGFEQMAKTLRNMSEILKPLHVQYETHKREESNNVQYE